MSQTVTETWKAWFSEDMGDEDGIDINGEDWYAGPVNLNRWKPFASELDWRVAMWAVREDIGQGSLNCLLSIPGVSFESFV